MKALFLLVVAIALAGCNPFAPDERDFTIKADSVVGPTAVSGGAAFTETVYGFVGPSGCYHFKEFRVSRTSGSADVTIVGHFKEGLCTQALVFMSETLTIQPLVTDPFVIRIHQPDNTILTKTIRAE